MILPVKKIFWNLLMAVIVLMVIYTINVVLNQFLANPLPEIYRNMFDINQEANVPTWFSATFLLLVALSALRILQFGRQLPGFTTGQRTFWAIVFAIYLALSLDETAMIHESAAKLVEIKWVVLYIPVIVLCFAYFVVALWGKKWVTPETAYWILGGVILSMIGGLLLDWVGYRFPMPFAMQQICCVLEESGEMLGAIFVLRGCLMEGNRLYQQLQNRS